MKIISLNTWAGRNLWSLTRFLRKMRAEVDVFCFQEIHNASREDVDRRHPDEFVRGDVMQVVAEELPDHVGVFAAHADDPVRMSNAMFIRRGLGVQNGQSTVYVPDEAVEAGSLVRTARILQWAIIDRLVGPRVLVGNMHGLWTPDGKEDSHERISQSEQICRVMAAFDGPRILCGDFNIYPHTRAWKLLFESFEDELVTMHSISTTRTPLYRHFQDPELDAAPIDFCFVKDVTVKDFRRLPDVVTDHSPLLLWIE